MDSRLAAARTWLRRRVPYVTRLPFLVTVAVIVVLAVAYTLAGFGLVPRLIARYVPQYAQEQLKRRAQIGEVRFNPFLFKLEVEHFRLHEADGRPLLGFDRLFVDFEPTSLFRKAWTFADVQLDAPRADVILTRDGTLNLLDLLDALPQGDPASRSEPKAPRPVLLEHAVVRGGWLTFTDLTGQAPQTAVMQPINVELRDLTTVPERRGPYRIAATLIGGGVVGWDGELSLFPLSSSGRLGIRGFPLATAWRFAQEDVTLAEPSGRLDGEVRYQLTYQDGKTSLEVEGVEVTVDGLVLTRRGDQAPLLALEKIRLAGGRGDLIARELTIPEISMSRGRLAATMARDGTVDWQTVVVAVPQAAPTVQVTTPPATSAAAGPEAPPWRVAVQKVRVEDVALAFADHSRATPIEVDVAGLTVDLAARVERGPARLAGTVDGVDLKLAGVAVREAAVPSTPLISLERVAVEGGRVDLESRQISASRIAVTGGGTAVVRAADGSLPLMTMLGPAEQAKPARPSARTSTSPRPPPAAKPWTVAVEKLDLADHRLAVTDRSVTPAVALQLDGIKVNARGLHTDGKKAIPFDASFHVAQGGRFTASGRVAPDGSSADATLTLARLALTPAQPYIARTAAVELRSGEVSTKGRLTYRRGADRAVLTYTGAADVDRVLVVEAAGGEPVLSWKSLHAETIRFGLAPDGLAIDEVRLAGPDGKIVIFKDKTLSLARLMRPAGAAPPGAPSVAGPAPSAAPPTGAPPAQAPPPAPMFPVAIERVRLDQGSMDFADLSLVLPFAARVHALSGVVVGVGSDPASRATVKLDGRVDEFGLVKVDGSLSPSQPKAFTDITVVFRNVPMTQFTPYSATFVGRRIVAGTLDMDLEYKIDRSALVGDNKVIVRRLQLGERVESPGAMQLPLDLAVAILSDSEGVIDLALPVRGNVDHPEFSYGHLVWQALVNVITKIATAPFRALAGLFGGSAENVEAVAFEAGSDAVPPPEREKLKRVAEVLGKRPRLKLTVHGSYEAKADGEALRSLRVRQDLARQLESKVEPGEDPGPVAFDRPKSQRALERLYAERGASIEEFQAAYEKTAGKKVERVNPVLVLLDRGAGDRAFYEALFHRLVETAPLADAELTALGQRRGEATARVLKESAMESASRVDVGDTEAAGRAERNTVPTRLELGVATGS